MKVELHIYKSDLDALDHVINMVERTYPMEHDGTVGVMTVDERQSVDKTARLHEILTYVYKVARDPSLAEERTDRPTFEELTQRYLQE